MSDLYQVTRWIREQYPELPLYLFGHSMGSLAVRCYLKRYPDVPDGVFVCGSPSAAFGLELGERVRAVLARKGRILPEQAAGGCCLFRIPETVPG